MKIELFSRFEKKAIAWLKELSTEEKKYYEWAKDNYMGDNDA
jgi:hypothetical protein